MAFKQHLEEAIKKCLDEGNGQLHRHERHYNAALDLMKKYGPAVVDLAQEQFGPEIGGVVKKVADDNKERFQRSLKGATCDVELVRNGTLLYLPVKRSDAGRLAKDIVEHVGEGHKQGLFNGYVTVAEAMYNATNTPLPPAMHVARVALTVRDLGPLTIDAAVRQTVEIGMTPTAVKYVLIPVRRENGAFFPPYKTPFTLDFPSGSTQAWVTSRNDGEHGKGPGGYIQGAPRNSSFRKAFKELELKHGDTVVMHEVVPQQRYAITDVKRKEH